MKREPSWQVFDRYADEYDLWYTKHPGVFESEVAAIKSLKLEGFGLELGVGSGMFAAALGLDLGIDPSLNMLRIAKGKGVPVVQAVSEQLPFRDKSFDHVLLINTLCFLEKPDVTMNEVWRVLKDKGSLILCEVPRDSSWGKLIEEKGRKGHRFYSHAKLYAIKEIRCSLEDAGFRVVDVKGTISFNPRELEMVEEPESNTEGNSFVCLQAIKKFDDGWLGRNHD
jgi:ubiquinone/menaquinone biosynthesis C-methylase UbiE